MFLRMIFNQVRHRKEEVGGMPQAGRRAPAATAQNWNHGPWKDHGFVGQLGEKVLEVNAPAAALGVKPGMTVEEALKRMSDRRNPVQ